jgi:hypothetical protein
MQPASSVKTAASEGTNAVATSAAASDDEAEADSPPAKPAPKRRRGRPGRGGRGGAASAAAQLEAEEDGGERGAADGDGEESDDSDREDVDWEEHPAQGIFAAGPRDKVRGCAGAGCGGACVTRGCRSDA